MLIRTLKFILVITYLIWFLLQYLLKVLIGLDSKKDVALSSYRLFETEEVTEDDNEILRYAVDYKDWRGN